MISVEHVIVCYGNELGYHHGAKYQILSAYKRWYGRPNTQICVVTDKPDLFETYPCRILELDSQKKYAWSMHGLQHFGIKLKGFSWAVATSSADVSLLLDTDMYWIDDPAKVMAKMSPSRIAMYRNEGPIFGSSNRSIQRFEEGLSEKQFKLSRTEYSLSHYSEMWASNLIGITPSQLPVLDFAFELFQALEPQVAAHTVEQFAIGEAARILGLEKIESKKYLRHWSTTGRKNYVTPVLKDFFQEVGECDFPNHTKLWRRIKIKRPFLTLLEQKITKRLFV